jgi:hypothetical protein
VAVRREGGGGSWGFGFLAKITEAWSLSICDIHDAPLAALSFSALFLYRSRDPQPIRIILWWTDFLEVSGLSALGAAMGP